MKAYAWAVCAMLVVAACLQRGNREPTPEWQVRQQKMNEITTLWAQIRGWRHDAHMDLDPPPALLFEWRAKPFVEAKRVCPDGHAVPKSCGEICLLAEDICDNAERICIVADELGKTDQPAQEKCTSAKASCREAKQRCCNCTPALEVVP